MQYMPFMGATSKVSCLLDFIQSPREALRARGRVRREEKIEDRREGEETNREYGDCPVPSLNAGRQFICSVCRLMISILSGGD